MGLKTKSVLIQLEIGVTIPSLSFNFSYRTVTCTEYGINTYEMALKTKTVPTLS